MKWQKIMNKIYVQFTGKYQLAKTLRFELKSVGKTEHLLKTNKVFEKDQTIDESYNQAKFYFDVLHREFISSAMSVEKIKNLSFQTLTNTLEEQNKAISVKRKEIGELRKMKKDKNDPRIKKLQKEINNSEDIIRAEREKLYKKICEELFDSEADNWKAEYEGKEFNVNGEEKKKIKFSKADIKQKGTNFLTTAGILKVLKYKFPKEKESEFQTKKWPSLYVEQKENPGQKRYIFDSFDGFTGYLSKFQQTRKNLYAADGTATAVATRIVDNFVIFLQNIKVFDDKYKNSHAEIGFGETIIFDIKQIDQYKNYLLQKDIEDVSNKASYNKIIGKINPNIKEHRDKKSKELGKNFTKSDFPYFKTLENQILGKIEKERQLIEKTEEKPEERVLIERFEEFIKDNQKRFQEAKLLMDMFCKGEFESEYDGIYLKNRAINTISRRWFADWRSFEMALQQQSSKSKTEKDEPKIKKFISIAEIKSAVEEIEGDAFKAIFYDKGVIAKDKDEKKQDKWTQFLAIWKHEFENLFADIEMENGETVRGYDSCLTEAKKLNILPHDKKERTQATAVIKDYADAGLGIYQMMKYFALDDKDRKNAPSQLSTNFYAEYDKFYKDFKFIKYYNAFRNFLTKKPFDEDKIKLNFENGALLKGWDEYDYMGVLLLKNEQYYLGIMHKNHRTLFKDIRSIESGEGCFRKMVYKQIADASKDVPRLLLTSAKARKKFKPSQEILIIKRKATFKRESKDFSLADLHTLIEYYRNCIPKYSNWNCYDFKFKDTNQYQNIKEFTDDVQRYGYKISFANIDNDYVNQAINDGKLYLLEITNKDIANTKSGTKSLHTAYFKNLLSQSNLIDPVIKLSGMAEIFQRSPSVKEKEKITTQKNKYILEKGERAYRHRRYTEKKIMFNVSVLFNTGKGEIKHGQFNKMINREALSASMKEVNVIGIDRGEKNLLYYSVVNQKGEILEDGSLNEINGVNYHDKLIVREKERLINRQSWQPVAKIKDLKKGYISHVIHKICQLIEQHNAIVVLEDLNMRFKQIRGGIERSVYQQFEKALIDKLGYLVFKDNRDLRSPGGVLNGYQLVAPFTSFEKMGKQTGILFYTEAEYTSKTDPVTGFRKNIYISNSASQEKIRETIKKIDAIGWDEQKQSYFFRYNPVKLADEKYKKSACSPKDGWAVYAKVPRIRRQKGEDGYWEYQPVDVNAELEKLFKVWNFENPKAEDIKQEIIRKERDLIGEREFDGKSRSFWHSFIYLFNLVLEIRNSFSMQIKMKDGKIVGEERGIDFIASPVKPFFTTPNPYEETNLCGLDIENGDANGAYNIARKGVMLLKEIKNNPNNPNLYISNYDWDNAVKDWDKYVKNNQ